VQPQKPRKRRTAVLRVRLTVTEREAIDAAAKKAGLGPCSFLRVVGVSAVGMKPSPPPRRKRPPSETDKSLAKFLGELGRIGANLNQCARRANSGFNLDPNTLEDIRNDLRQLRNAVVAYQEKS